MALQLDDGTFVHFVTLESADGANPLAALEAFKRSNTASKSVASRRRGQAMRPSSATIGCLASHETMRQRGPVSPSFLIGAV
jgi:hypothetical protein